MEKNEVLTAFGSRVRARREELGMSQQELATRLGYKSRSSINKIELGKNDVAQSTIKHLADALNTSPAYLMGWDYDEKTTSQDLLDVMEEISRDNFAKWQNRSLKATKAKAKGGSIAKPGDSFMDGHMVLSDLETTPDGSISVKFEIDGDKPFEQALLALQIATQTVGLNPRSEDVEEYAHDLAHQIVQDKVKDFLEQATPEQRKRFDEEMKKVYEKVYEIYFGTTTSEESPDK
ncbi:MAG: helix-turn-helix transcriptional regulator [Oscillospiraceae bacterium]|nr:helix-turn-helix transcriptional regulator [Oscillospiraceae bacterium]